MTARTFSNIRAFPLIQKLVAASLALIVSGCALLDDLDQQPPQLNPLEVQSLQSHSFGADKRVVFASVVSVFQDLGYTVSAADLDTGFISAQGRRSTSDEGQGEFTALHAIALLGGLFGSRRSSDDKPPPLPVDQGRDITQVNTRATAFIEQIGREVRVRLNLVEAVTESSSRGQTTTKDRQILDASQYRNAFNRIQDAIFVRTRS